MIRLIKVLIQGKEDREDRAKDAARNHLGIWTSKTTFEVKSDDGKTVTVEVNRPEGH